jgi:hypothetical protein
MSNRKPRRDDEPPQSLEEFVQDQLPEDDTDDPSSDEQVPLPDQDPDRDQDDSGEEDSLLPVSGAPLGLLLLVLVSQVVPLLKLTRRLVRRRRPRASTRVGGAWRELVDLGVDLRLPVPDGATREAQALALGVPEDLAKGADDLIFAIAPPGAADAAAYWREAERARRGLAKRHSLWRQVGAVYNPRSLVLLLRRRGPSSARRRLRMVVPLRGRRGPAVGGA